ncbi:MAG: hypothetical protein Q7W30_01865 [Coriobacteriia bacterium]|nr:hypothetical protein [Coriobacteriia bacterium]
MKRQVSGVLALAALMVLCAASVAYALSPGYIQWNAADNLGSLLTPHKDYQLTTRKCAVCHSVHAAGWYQTENGAWDGTMTAGEAVAGEKSELLLRGNAANSCSYCHIQSAIGGKVIYDGVVTNYNGQTPFAHNGDPGHAACVACHSVHGAATMDGAVSSKILKSGATGVAPDGRLYQNAALATLGGGDPVVIDQNADRDLQITAYCTKCHPTFSDGSEQVISSTTFFTAGSFGIVTGLKFFKNHPLKAVGGELDGTGQPSSFVASGSTVGTNTAVAYTDAKWCRSCHAAGVDGAATSTWLPPTVITNSFPHYTPGNAFFLIAAPDALTPASGVASDTESADGVCLRCHRSGDGKGVGLDF